MAAPPLLTLDGIALTFGGEPLLTDAGLVVYPRDRICLVGRNGSGKSTLLKIAAGRVEPDSGTRFVKPGTSWRYLEQDPDMAGFATLEDFVRSGLQGADSDARVPYLLDALSVNAGADPRTASGGERRRAAIARALAPEPDVLLLDEPTNHLDLPTIEWLEAEIARSPAALVLISHDRAFLAATTRRTVWLDRGVSRVLDEGFAAFEDWRDATLEQEATDRHKLARQIAREEHWVVHGVSGRRKRNMRRLGELGELKKSLATAKLPQGAANVSVAEAERSGKRVVELRGVSKAYGERVVVRAFSIKVSRGERVAIVGPNGAGKTTLVKLLTGTLEPDSGTVVTGSNIEPLVLEQSRGEVAPDTTLGDALTGGGTDGVEVDGQTRHVVAYMKDFLFLPEQRNTPVGRLSGGERARVQLARGLRNPSNLLVLDEPTNDLDLETLDLLQEIVGDYAGTVILVSHDRDFIDRLATRTIAHEGEGRWGVYAGGYSDMVAQRRATAAPKDAPRETAKGPGKAKGSGGGGAGKLSFKHVHRLEVLPGEMAATEAEIEKLEAGLAAPDLYARDPDAFARLAGTLEAAKSRLIGLEDEWLELEEMREAVEG